MSMPIGKAAKKTIADLKRKVRSKIRNLEKKGFVVEPTLDFNAKQRKWETVKEYNEWKKQIKKFINRNNYDYKPKKTDKGVEYLPAEKKYLKKAQKESIKLAKEKQAEIDAKLVYDVDGNFLGTHAQLKAVLKQKEEYRIPTEMEIEDLPSRNVISKRIKIFAEREKPEYYDIRDKQLKERWLDKFKVVFGDDAKDVTKKLEKMSPNDFVEMYYMFANDMDFAAFYPIESLGDDSEEQHWMRVDEAYEAFKKTPNLGKFR